MESTAEHSIPLDILDDLSSRFIINVPEEERKDLIRIFFQIEQAHWFYLDFYCAQERSKLKTCSIKEFAAHIFQHIPFLKPFYKDLDGVWEQWREYKQAVPTFGAIVLNSALTHVLLVQSFWAKTSWGFPKGKVNADEDPSRCAVREVLEETGCDIGGLLDPADYIEATVNYQLTRLYVVVGVRDDTEFRPLTRNEIRSVEWFAIADLPTNKKDSSTKAKTGVGPNSFYMVVPFVKKIRTWIWNRQQRQSQEAQGARRPRHKSVGDGDAPRGRTQPAPTLAPTESRKIPAVRDATKELRSLKRSTVRAVASPQNRAAAKPATKRQLFANEEDSVEPRKAPVRSAPFVFRAPAWADFKLDREAILKEVFQDFSKLWPSSG